MVGRRVIVLEVDIPPEAYETAVAEQKSLKMCIGMPEAIVWRYCQARKLAHSIGSGLDQ